MPSANAASWPSECNSVVSCYNQSAHHALVFVFEDMAMIKSLPRMGLRHLKTDSFARLDVH